MAGASCTPSPMPTAVPHRPAPNCSTLSLKGLRKLLEEDMGLAEGALKEHKAVLEATVSAVRTGGWWVGGRGVGGHDFGDGRPLARSENDRLALRLASSS